MTKAKRNHKKTGSEVKTFSVPFALGEKKENITITSNAPSKPKKEEIINKAFKFHSQGNTIEAVKYYQILINQGFQDHRVFSNYGIILENLGKFQEAEHSYRKAIEVRPDYANAHLNLGNILKDLGKPKEAELSLRKAIELNPNFSEAHYNLGGILIDLGNLEEAEISTRKAIELNPNFAIAYNNLGTILKDLGNLKEAELSIRKAILLKSNFAEAHSNLGGILKSLGNLKEAEISTREAIELNPELAVAHSNLGNILKDLGNLKEAKASRLKAFEINPKLEDNTFLLAEQLYAEENYEKAMHYLKDNNHNRSQSLYLSCLLCLDREKEFNQKSLEFFKKGICNAEIGGIVEHANIIYEANYNSPFCNQAINYVHWDKINEVSFSNEYLNQLIDYLKESKHENRSQGLLKQGIQTSGDLFSLDFPFIDSIKKALELKIEIYKNKFKDSGQGFINNWPENYELRSWMISMKTGGFLKSHNHEYGWITGSFYLQIPKYNDNDNDNDNNNDNDSGNIAFSYQGPRYPNKDKDFNLTIKKVETRDICIFPSSLFHHTIPFESSEERICFVFDLIQK